MYTACACEVSMGHVKGKYGRLKGEYGPEKGLWPVKYEKERRMFFCALPSFSRSYTPSHRAVNSLFKYPFLYVIKKAYSEEKNLVAREIFDIKFKRYILSIERIRNRFCALFF